MYLKHFEILSLSLSNTGMEWKLILIESMPMIKNCSWFVRLLNPKAESLAIFQASKKIVLTQK